MATQIYCIACHTVVTLHADGSLACSCEVLDADSEEVPTGWTHPAPDDDVLTEVRELRAAEARYQQGEP